MLQALLPTTSYPTPANAPLVGFGSVTYDPLGGDSSSWALPGSTSTSPLGFAEILLLGLPWKG